MSGQIPINPETNQIVENDIIKQTVQVLENIKKFVESFDLTLDNIVKTTIFVKNINDFNTINEIYAEYFTSEPPARSLVEVSFLPKNVLIEIECIVAVK
jgi:2-iminobutanoate/2-iminopropanoate deaminase